MVDQKKLRKKLLIAQLNSKRTIVNERQLERAISKHFKTLKQEVLDNLEEYWSEYQLLQGQIDLITAPILDSQEDYNNILVKYNKREYTLGMKEGKRLVDIANDTYAEKGILDYIKTRIVKDSLFGTIDWTEEDLLTQIFTASKTTLARVSKEINQIITDGYTSGKGINVVANMITRRFDQLETWEAKRIARTEIHSSHNQGVMRIYQDMNVQYTQWISRIDKRTRTYRKGDKADHIKMDGEIIRLGDTYSNGLKYPGDKTGKIEEWINCRCSNAPYVMRYGYTAPPGMSSFQESDLIKL